MNREIKNNGVYVEVDADKIVENFEQLVKADVVVITKARIELAGDDKERFLKSLSAEIEALDGSNDLTPAQKSDCALRNMVCN